MDHDWTPMRVYKVGAKFPKKLGNTRVCTRTLSSIDTLGAPFFQLITYTSGAVSMQIAAPNNRSMDERKEGRPGMKVAHGRLKAAGFRL